jgi:hypothetical protein
MFPSASGSTIDENNYSQIDRHTWSCETDTLIITRHRSIGNLLDEVETMRLREYQANHLACILITNGLDVSIGFVENRRGQQALSS